PKFGQTLEDIGLLPRSELTRPNNLKAIFRDIRNHLAGNTTGITRDQSLALEMMSILFCKIFDEINTAPDDLPQFRTRVDEAAPLVALRISELCENVKKEYADVFSPNETISLDPSS